MRKVTLAGTLASTLATVFLGLAAVPAGTAQQPDRASVVADRAGQDVTQTVNDDHGHSFRKVPDSTVYVDVK
jgi:hypothetical protein